MGFIDETTKLLGFDNSTANHTFCHISPMFGIVVEGYKKIHELSHNKISVLCQDKKTLEIFGEKLTIKEISYKELCINGVIKSINFA